MKRNSSKHGCYSVDPMPAQSQLALCHSFFVPVTLRGNGFGHRLKKSQMKALVEQRYDYAICTVAGDNLAQQSVLSKSGWRRIASFPNSKTGGHTEVWGWLVGDWSGE